ncbi:MAG TPA: hypothetical protein VHA35_13825 [Dongiaceae bacterium]|nr:hypothetical protein [Dongiaceae bacterium]
MLDRNELRALIRDVISTELAAVKAERAPQAPAAEHRVRIASDADLAAFARQVLALAGDANVQKKIAAGTYPFRLDGASGAAPGSMPSSGGAARIDKGVVTEGALLKLPRGTRRLQIGAEVSVTPLARDKASSLGITIERMKP